NSFRLVPLNALLGAILIAVAVLAYALHAAVVLVVLAGPVAAALVHCAVTLVRTGNMTLADARDGFRLHWRRGLAPGAGVPALGLLPVRFSSGLAYGWPLVFFTLSLLVLVGIYQAVLWTLAIADPDKPLRTIALEAGALGASRPGSTLLLGLALLLLNLGGIAAAVMPFLTLTVA